jgi:murein DD-endopeptidase MepM/ murein hydrolase activator NlpD
MERRARPIGPAFTLAIALIVLVAVGSACAPATSARATANALLMPVEGMRVGDVVSNFGAARGGRMHEGVDIFAPRGTRVFSAGHGVVHFLGATALGGWTVWVRDGNRDIWYTHLDAIAPGLSRSARVTPETAIGWVGNSGNASGGPTHLHFELVTPQGAVDPLPFLADRF